ENRPSRPPIVGAVCYYYPCPLFHGTYVMRDLTKYYLVYYADYRRSPPISSLYTTTMLPALLFCPPPLNNPPFFGQQGHAAVARSLFRSPPPPDLPRSCYYGIAGLSNSVFGEKLP
ncbi:unnamed protein product, partial [Laminaria digitata]